MEYGGVIYFGASGFFVQDRFCSNECCSTGSGLHSHSSLSKHIINLSSLSQCGQNNTGSCSLYHSDETMSLTSLNITQTRCNKKSGYHIQLCYFNISFCCFISNNNQENACLYHETTPHSFIKRSNFKNNSCDSYFLYASSNIEATDINISECIFFENNVSTVFYANHDSTIYIIDCTGDSLTIGFDDAPHPGTINTDQMKTDPFNLTLSLLSLGKCEAEFPFSFDLILFESKKKYFIIYLPFSFSFSLLFLINIKK